MALLPASKRFLLAILALGALSAGCAFNEASLGDKGMKPLSGAEVKALLGKARYRWEAAQGATGSAITSGDGRVRVIWETGALNGRMRFTQTGYCSRFEGVRGGVEDCYRLYRTGPLEYTVFKEDGTHSGRIALTN